jgi:anoctamin-4
MTYWSRFFRLMATGSIVMFMIFVVLGAVLGTIIYRISLVSIIYSGFDGVFIKSHAKLFTSMTAALINLIIIMLLTKVKGLMPALSLSLAYGAAPTLI